MSTSKPQLIVDTRQQANKHRLKHAHFERAGYELVRQKLDYGDYCLAGSTLTVDTKRNITELAQNVQQGHERFRRECLRAQEAGGVLVVLVENKQGVRVLSELAGWREPHYAQKIRRSRYPLQGTRIARACDTMRHKYGVLFAFCAPQEAGERVLWLLNHENELREKSRRAIRDDE